MIILCVFLFQGSRRAWYFGLFLTLISAVTYFLKGSNYEEAIFALITGGSLFYTGGLYKVKSHPKLIRVSNVVLVFSIFAIYALGVIGFYSMNPRHFGSDFDFLSAVTTSFNLFFMFDTGTLIPATTFARNFIYTMNLSSGLILCFIFYNILKPYVTKPFNSPDDRILAGSLVQKYGHSSLDYFKTYPDKFYFFNSEKDGFLAYKVTRNFAFVLENPVCKDEATTIELIKSFDLYCQENGFISVYYRIPAASLDLYRDLGKRDFPIGDEAIVDLEGFSLDGFHVKTTRDSIKRYQSMGYHAKTYQAPISDELLNQLEHVSNSWLRDLNQKEMAFAEGIFSKKILRDQTIMTIEDEHGKVSAFLNVIPDYVSGEATFDLIRKSTDAPKELMDMLVVHTLLYFKEQGYRAVNLGMAPLSAVEGAGFTHRALKFAYQNMKTFSHFNRLRRFKGKYTTRWEQKFLIYNQNYHLPQIPRALKRVAEGR